MTGFIAARRCWSEGGSWQIYVKRNCYPCTLTLELEGTTKWGDYLDEEHLPITLKVNAQRIETSFPMLVISLGWPRKELYWNQEQHRSPLLGWWQGVGSRGQPTDTTWIPWRTQEQGRRYKPPPLSSFRQAVGVTLLTESLRGKCRARICGLDFQQNDAGSITWVAAVGNSFWLRPWNIWSWAADLREEKTWQHC